MNATFWFKKSRIPLMDRSPTSSSLSTMACPSQTPLRSAPMTLPGSPTAKPRKLSHKKLWTIFNPWMLTTMWSSLKKIILSGQCVSGIWRSRLCFFRKLPIRVWPLLRLARSSADPTMTIQSLPFLRKLFNNQRKRLIKKTFHVSTSKVVFSTSSKNFQNLDHLPTRKARSNCNSKPTLEPQLTRKSLDAVDWLKVLMNKKKSALVDSKDVRERLWTWLKQSRILTKAH